MGDAMEDRRKEVLPLPEAVTHLLEECRMVLPGIQALFGFQLIVVFNDGFDEKLSHGEQVIHLCAIGLVALAVALVMAPAAFHRQNGPREVTQEFVAVATRLLLWSMFPLMIGICLDFYLIARIIIGKASPALLVSLTMLAVFCTLWFLLPRLKTLRSLIGSTLH
jgi:hypothetical protein